MSTRTLKERFYHALGFEVIAIAIISPVIALLMNKPLFQTGTLAILLSTVAMVWNMIYNMGFDRLFPRDRVYRGLFIRILHAFGFEAGFVLIALPPVAWMLDVTLWQAFIIEIAVFLFFLPYTVIYNWVYDKLRDRLVGSQEQQIRSSS
jgi:uncharacterized membrane protein